MQHVPRNAALLTLVVIVFAQLATAQDPAPVPAHTDVKRADWSSMRGTWGKRSDLDDVELETPEDKRGGWNKFQGSWGKRSDEMTDSELQMAEDKRANWNKFQGSWGKRADDFEEAEDKRNGWKNFQGSWGKRDDDLMDDEEKRANWNKFQGSWGKRNNWSSLQGSWGKRAWKNLQGAWGKRNGLVNPADEVADEEEEAELQQALISPAALARLMKATPQKRGWSLFGKKPEYPSRLSPRSTNWSSLRGTWGKRSSDWSSLRGAWGKKAGDWSQFRGTWGKRDLDGGNGATQVA